MSLAVEQRSGILEKTRKPRNELSIDFRSKLKHESKTSSSKTRSDLFYIHPQPYLYNVWTLQPPNFNAQAFEPNPSKQKEYMLSVLKEECRMMSELSKQAPTAEERRRNDKRLRDLFIKLSEIAAEKQLAEAGYFRPVTERPSFRLRFKPKDKLEGKIDFAKHGTHKKEPYVSPQLHDYRQYPKLKTLGLPEFITKYETDCFGLKCKSKGLSIMQGPAANVLREVPVRTKSEYALPRYPIHDSNLVLPKLPFPNKYSAYSRHRRKDRSARSAFLERAEVMMIRRAEDINEFRNKYQLNSEQ